MAAVALRDGKSDTGAWKSRSADTVDLLLIYWKWPSELRDVILCFHLRCGVFTTSLSRRGWGNVLSPSGRIKSSCVSAGITHRLQARCSPIFNRQLLIYLFVCLFVCLSTYYLLFIYMLIYIYLVIYICFFILIFIIYLFIANLAYLFILFI